jgi:uncharacterized membrane protein
MDMDPSRLKATSDRALSTLAHGAIAFGIFGVTFPVALGVSAFLWLYSKRSPQVRFHAEQAGCYQCSVLVVNVVFIIGLALSGGFAIFEAFQGRPWQMGPLLVLGFILFGLWFAGSIIYGLLAALAVLRGKEFKYPIIGDWAKKRQS